MAKATTAEERAANRAATALVPISENGGALSTSLAARFKVKSHITLPLLKLEDDRIYIVRIDKPIFQAPPEQPRINPETGEVMEKSRSAAKQPPFLTHVAHFTDDGSGELYQMITPAVLKSELQKGYPDDSYVGRTFAIQKFREAGKSYNLFNITEVEDTEPEAAPVVKRGVRR